MSQPGRKGAFALWLSEIGRYVTIHCFCAATLATSIAMCATAGDLGPFAAPLIAAGLYAGFFAVSLEALLLARIATAMFARRFVHD